MIDSRIAKNKPTFFLAVDSQCCFEGFILKKMFFVKRVKPNVTMLSNVKTKKKQQQRDFSFTPIRASQDHIALK